MRTITAAALCVLALSACSQGSDPTTSSPTATPTASQTPSASGTPSASQTPGTPTPTATRTGTVTDLRTLIPSRPTKPRAEFNDASAIAFVTYFLESMFAAYGSGDSTELQRISAPTCALCTKALTNVKNMKPSPGCVIVGDSAPSLTDPVSQLTEGRISNVSGTVTLPRITVVNTKTGKQSGSWAAGATASSTIGLEFDDTTGWKVITFRDVYKPR